MHTPSSPLSPFWRVVAALVVAVFYIGAIIFVLPLLFRSTFYSNIWLDALDSLLLLVWVSAAFLYFGCRLVDVRQPVPGLPAITLRHVGNTAALAFAAYVVMLTSGLILLIGAWYFLQAVRGKNDRANALVRRFIPR